MVSINCITYNHEDYIAEAIESFLMQHTTFDFEILIGEDCSTDNTRQIIEEYVENYPDKIKLITAEKNVGGRENSKRLQRNSKGKYVAICEGDDYWIDSNKLQQQIDYMEQNENCTLCFHAAKTIEDGRSFRKNQSIRPYSIDKVIPIEDLLGEGGFCPSASLIYRKDMMDNPPEYYSKAHVGDYPLQIYMASKGYVYYFSKPMSVYRMNAKDSWTNRINSEVDYISKYVEVFQSDIQLLHTFNVETKFKYKAAVEQAILQKNFNICLLRRKSSQLRSPEYKSIVNKLKLKQKLKFYLISYFPRSYSNVIKVKKILNTRQG